MPMYTIESLVTTIPLGIVDDVLGPKESMRNQLD